MSDQIKHIGLPSLAAKLNSSYGRDWTKWEPETFLGEEGLGSDPLLHEKIPALQACAANLNYVLTLPEFFLWFVSLANDQPAEFEGVSHPNTLEIAWALDQAKKLAGVLGQPWQPGTELATTVNYLLTQDGFRGPTGSQLPPEVFSDVPVSLAGNKGDEDVAVSQLKGISLYKKFMEKAHA